jgi:Ni,Fe-hydrogenase I large subunit
MFKNLINSYFSRSLKTPTASSVEAFLRNSSQVNLALNAGSRSFLINFKPYEIKPEQQFEEDEHSAYRPDDEDVLPKEDQSQQEEPMKQDRQNTYENDKSSRFNKSQEPPQDNRKKGF